MHELVARPAPLAGLEIFVAPGNRLPGPVPHVEQQCALRRHFDLRVESRALQFFSALEQLQIEGIALRKRVLIKRRGNLVQPRIQGIHQDQSLLRK